MTGDFWTDWGWVFAWIVCVALMLTSWFVASPIFKRLERRDSPAASPNGETDSSISPN